MDSILAPNDHLSPPSTTSRLSDSDTSECDLDGVTAGSSLGSSSSPPPEVTKQQPPLSMYYHKNCDTHMKCNKRNTIASQKSNPNQPTPSPTSRLRKEQTTITLILSEISLSFSLIISLWQTSIELHHFLELLLLMLFVITPLT